MYLTKMKKIIGNKNIFEMITSRYFIIFISFIILASNVNAIDVLEKENKIIEDILNNDLENESVCTEQLNELILIYNNLFEEFKEGNNCGGAFYILKDANKELAQERDVCISELDKLSKYKFAFYSSLIVLIITGLILSLSKKKD